MQTRCTFRSHTILRNAINGAHRKFLNEGLTRSNENTERENDRPNGTAEKNDSMGLSIAIRYREGNQMQDVLTASANKPYS